MFTIKSLPSYIACHDSLDPLVQTLGIWIQDSGAEGHVSWVTYFSNLLEDKDRRLKIKLTLSLIMWVNLRLGSTPYGVQNRTPYKEDWTTTWGMSTSQPQRSQGSTRRTPSRRSSGELEDTFRSTRMPAVLGYEELEGLSDPGARDCPRGVLLVGYGTGHGPRPTSVVTTCSAVGLLIQ
jgi:hypothetical protein